MFDGFLFVGCIVVCMEEVYLFDSESETIVGEGVRNEEGCVVVQDESLSALTQFTVIPKSGFYYHESVQEVVPQSRRGTQVHVECMKCGFETVYGVRALIRSSRWESKRDGYPQRSAGCQECGANVWKEVCRQFGTCDWSDEFEWADPPEGNGVTAD